MDICHVTCVHKRFLTILRSSPAVISFYNQRMQIRICRQPINHIRLAINSAAQGTGQQTYRTVNFLRELRYISFPKGIWDISRTFNFHQRLSGRVGCLSQESFVSRRPEPLPAGKQSDKTLLHLVQSILWCKNTSFSEYN